jgi:hypothetical protein
MPEIYDTNPQDPPEQIPEQVLDWQRLDRQDPAQDSPNYWEPESDPDWVISQDLTDHVQRVSDPSQALFIQIHYQGKTGINYSLFLNLIQIESVIDLGDTCLVKMVNGTSHKLDQESRVSLLTLLGEFTHAV